MRKEVGNAGGRKEIRKERRSEIRKETGHDG